MSLSTGSITLCTPGPWNDPIGIQFHHTANTQSVKSKCQAQCACRRHSPAEACLRVSSSSIASVWFGFWLWTQAMRLQTSETKTHMNFSLDYHSPGAQFLTLKMNNKFAASAFIHGPVIH